MSEISGVIEQKTSAMRRTRNGDVEVFSLKVNGEWYGCGFKKLPAGAEEGANVTFSFQQSGQYKNLDASTVQVQSAAPAPAPNSSAARGGNANDDRQRVIVYQSARNAAVETVAALAAAEALPLPTKKGDKYDAVMAVVSELTDRYHTDAMAVFTGDLEVIDPDHMPMPSHPSEDD